MKKDIKEVFSSIWGKTKDTASRIFGKAKELAAKAWEKTKVFFGEVISKLDEKIKTTLPTISYKLKKIVLIVLASLIGLGIIYAIIVNAYANDTHVFKGDKCENCGISSSLVYKFEYISETDSYSVVGRKIWKNKYDDVILPDTYKGKPVSEIGEGAFCDYKKLVSVKIPGSVKTIGNSAFAYCSRLEEVTLSEGIEIIDFGAFYSCTSLEGIVIPDSVKTIGNCAFEGCRWMKTLHVGSGLESLDVLSFAYCNIDTITGGGEKYYVSGNCLISLVEGEDASRITVVVGANKSFIPEDVDAIGGYAFSGRLGLTEVILPVNVTKLYPYAYYECDGIKKATLGSITEIPYRAFYSCEGLEELTIPETVTAIRDEAFHSCIKLLKVAIPDACETIGASAFTNCGSISELVIGSGVTYIGDRAFTLCHALTSAEFKNTEGWWVTKDASAQEGDAVAATELSNKEKAAELLYKTYGYYIWNRD